MIHQAALLFSLAAAFTLAAQEGPRQSFESSATEHIPIRPGGAIRLEHSYGYLTVEGWDEPEVQITTVKSTDRFYKASEKERAGQRLGQVEIAVQGSGQGVDVSTNAIARRGFVRSALRGGETVITLGMRPLDKRGVTVDYTVLVPRASNLAVRQDSGYIWIAGLTGDLEVRSRAGDLTVLLPDPGPYAIDARTRLGSLTSDIAGHSAAWFLTGRRFLSSAAPAHRVYLRIGRGSIAIKSGPDPGPLWKN